MKHPRRRPRRCRVDHCLESIDQHRLDVFVGDGTLHPCEGTLNAQVGRCSDREVAIVRHGGWIGRSNNPTDLVFRNERRPELAAPVGDRRRRNGAAYVDGHHADALVDEVRGVPAVVINHPGHGRDVGDAFEQVGRVRALDLDVLRAVCLHDGDGHDVGIYQNRIDWCADDGVAQAKRFLRVGNVQEADGAEYGGLRRG